MNIIDSLEFLKEQKWIDLTHTVHNAIPYFQDFKPMGEKTLFTVEGHGFFAKQYQIVSQYGTHLDSPVHFAEGMNFVEDIPIKELVLPLYVIHKEKEVAENNDYAVSVADIEDFERKNGVIPAGSFVAFASGWSKRWDNPKSYYNLDHTGQAHTPGWSMEALKFLHEKRDVAAIGHETLDTDTSVDCSKNNGLIGELYWLGKNKYQVEVLNQLSKLPATGGIIMIGVPKIKDCPGFTSRAIAIVPNK